MKRPYHDPADEAEAIAAAAVRQTLRHGVNSSELPEMVTESARASIRSELKRVARQAEAVLEQEERERSFLNVEADRRYRKRKQNANRIDQPMKPWTVYDYIRLALLFLTSIGGLGIEWHAISRLLMQADPLHNQSLLTGLLATGLMLLFPTLLKSGAVDPRDHYRGNRIYRLALFLVSFVCALTWLVCFAARNDDNPLNSLATQLLSPVLTPEDAAFETRLFFAQMVSQALGSATISAFLWLTAEFMIRTYARVGDPGTSLLITPDDAENDLLNQKLRELAATRGRAQGLLDSMSAQEQAFLRKSLAKVDAVTKAKDALRYHIGPFHIVVLDENHSNK